MRSLVFASAFLLAALGYAQPQGQPRPPYGTPPTFPEEKAPREQMPPDQQAKPLSNAEVRHQIQQGMKSEPELANTNISVKTNDSSVVLTGTVDTERQHDLAVRIAQSYAADRQIVDKIKVGQRT